MSRSKKVFLAFAAVFFVTLAFVSYDISRRTTFPGSKSQLKERLKKQFFKEDSVTTDTTKAIRR